MTSSRWSSRSRTTSGLRTNQPLLQTPTRQTPLFIAVGLEVPIAHARACHDLRFDVRIPGVKATPTFHDLVRQDNRGVVERDQVDFLKSAYEALVGRRDKDYPNWPQHQIADLAYARA